MALETALRRGPTLRRLAKVIRQPEVLFRNLRFLQSGRPSAVPCIFVLGPPRSGTTLVQNILLAHSRVTGPRHETRFFFRSNFSDHFIPDMDERDYRRLLEASSSQVDLFERVARHYMEAEGGSHFVEKTPEHALRLRFLQERFPRSKFVFCVRDPRDGFLSSLRNPRIKLHDPRDFAETWARCADELAAARPASVAVLKYEELCASPLEKIEALMAFLGVPFEELQLRPANVAATPVSREEGHTRLGAPIGGETVGVWRRDLGAADRQVIEAIAGRGMATFGYGVSP